MKDNKISRKEMVEKLGISPYGFDLMLIRGTMDVKTLEKISEILKVPVSYWFDENIVTESNHVDNTSILLDQLRVKDKQIEFLQNLLSQK